MILRIQFSPSLITGSLFADLISVASAPASGSKGCAGYVKPLNRAESFWRQTSERQVRDCVKPLEAAPRNIAQNVTPLHLAVWFSGSLAVIAALLKGGADPSEKRA